jgi:hypothetical protein
MPESYLAANKLLASQERLCSLELHICVTSDRLMCTVDEMEVEKLSYEVFQE